jgi:hypothetical protein
MYKEDLKECVSIPGFFYVQDLEFVVVSKLGIVLNSVTGLQFPINIRTGYPSINFGGKTGEIHIHRLVASTFLVKPKARENEKLFVNHLNGNKRDNRLVNLEWATPQRNCQHAYETGLRNDNVPVLSKDLRTNEILKFYSIWECARHHKLNGAHIHYYLKPKSYGKVRQKYFLFIKESQEWPNVDKKEIGLIGSNKNVLLFDNKKSFLFSSISEAASYLNLKMSTLAKRLRTSISQGNKRCKFDNYEVMYYEESEHEKIIDLIKVKSKPKNKFIPTPRKPLRIEVKNLLTGEIYQMQSINNLASKLNVNKNTLQKHIYQNNGIWHKKLHIRYL